MKKENLSIGILRVLPKEGVSSMEHFFCMNMSTITHHSFMRWQKNSARAKKEEKAVAKVFDPFSPEVDEMDRAYMLTALSA